MGKDTLPVSTGGEVMGGEEVVEVVLGEAGGMSVIVVEGSCSSVTGFVLVAVCAVGAVLEIVVLSVTKDVSETGAGLGLEEVTMGVTAAECVVASVVTLVGCTTRGGGVLVLIVVVVVGAVPVDDCIAGVVLVKSGCRMSLGLDEAVSQNRAVMANGALLVRAVLGPEGLVVELRAVVVRAVVAGGAVVGGASVTLTVDSGSTTSGLTVGVADGGDGGPAAVESSGATKGEMLTGRVGSWGAGDASEEVVCVLTAGVVVVILAVGPVCEGVEDEEVVTMVVDLEGVVEGAVLVVVAEVTAAEVS